MFMNFVLLSFVGLIIRSLLTVDMIPKVEAPLTCLMRFDPSPLFCAPKVQVKEEGLHQSKQKMV